jgi:hypothetical protein
MSEKTISLIKSKNLELWILKQNTSTIFITGGNNRFRIFFKDENYLFFLKKSERN